VFDIVEQFQQNMYLWMMLEDRSSQQTAKNRRKTLDSLLSRETHLYYSKYAQSLPLQSINPRACFCLISMVLLVKHKENMKWCMMNPNTLQQNLCQCKAHEDLILPEYALYWWMMGVRIIRVKSFIPSHAIDNIGYLLFCISVRYKNNSGYLHTSVTRWYPTRCCGIS